MEEFSCYSVSQYVQLFATPWIATHQASLSFTISQSLLRLMAHWVDDAIQPSHHLSSPFPLALSIRVFSSELALSIRWLNIELQPQHQSFQRIFSAYFLQDWPVWSPGCPSDSKESSPAPQFESINSSGLSLLYSPTFTFIHDYWKCHSFDSTELCRQTDGSVLKQVI